MTVGPPCSVYVETEDGRRYCEQGEDGHEGTHIGDRTQEEYDRLVVSTDPLRSSSTYAAQWLARQARAMQPRVRAYLVDSFIADAAGEKVFLVIRRGDQETDALVDGLRTECADGNTRPIRLTVHADPDAHDRLEEP